MGLVLPALCCFGSGFLLLSLGWTRQGSRPLDFLLRASLAAGFGLGIFSVIYFICLVCNANRFDIVDGAVLVALAAAFAVTGRFSHRVAVVNCSRAAWPDWLQRVLAGAFVISLLAAVSGAVMRMKAYPHGDGWDAFAIWNFHARFLFHGGSVWRDGFSSLNQGSHPDYPLLLPAAIAHFWTYLGHEDARVPALIGVMFAFATAGVLYAALAILRGRELAAMATIALLSTPFFVEQGTAQYADVPLGFFFLAATVLVCLFDCEPGTPAGRPARLLVMAGVAAGLAAWTKNEGLLFLVVLLISRVWVYFQAGPRDIRGGGLRENWTAIAPLVAGVIPGLIVVAYFKHFIAGPGDLFSGADSTLHHMQLARFGAIAGGYLKSVFRFGHWLLIPCTVLVAGLLFAFGADKHRSRQDGFRTALIALSLTLAGYFAVFMITPYDIYWHLHFSLDRLFLQCWPSGLFLCFLAVGRGAEEFVA